MAQLIAKFSRPEDTLGETIVAASMASVVFAAAAMLVAFA